MALLKEWQKVAYDETKDRGTLQRFWANYFNLEKGVYEKLLEEPDVEVKGTVKELAEKYGLSIMRALWKLIRLKRWKRILLSV